MKTNIEKLLCELYMSPLKNQEEKNYLNFVTNRFWKYCEYFSEYISYYKNNCSNIM